MSPAASSAAADGLHNVVAFAPLGLQLRVVNTPPCPYTKSADASPAPGSPLAALNGVLYRSTRLLPESATYKFPAGSTAIRAGPHRPSAPSPPTSVAATPLLHLNEKRSGCPRTISAGCALNAVTSLQPSTRLFALSATYRWRCGGCDVASTAIPPGECSPIASTKFGPLCDRSICPPAPFATLLPGDPNSLNSSTRLLAWSAT